MSPAQCLIRDQLALRRSRPAAIDDRPLSFEPRQRVIAAQNIGDNVLIEPQGGAIEIWGLSFWNPANAQTLIFCDGPAADGLYCQRWTNFPASSGFEKGQGRNWPHWVITPGRPFVLNLQLASIVDGSIIYIVR
jgi:hypothetical protein